MTGTGGYVYLEYQKKGDKFDRLSIDASGGDIPKCISYLKF